MTCPDAEHERQSALVLAARGGDHRAWEQLVVAMSPMLSRVVGRYRLSRQDGEDVVQLTWLRLLRHIDALQHPGAVRAWLVTTARREALRRLQSGARELPFSELPMLEDIASVSAEDEVLLRERRDALRAAIRELSPRQRAVVEALLTEPAPPYERIAEQLRIPVGSIGPTRARSIERLRRSASVQR